MDTKLFSWPLERTPDLSLPFSERRLLLVVQDLLAVNLALALTLTFWQSRAGGHWQGSALRPFWYLLLSGLYLSIAQALDAYSLKVAGRLGSSILSVAKAAAVTSVLYGLIPYVTPALPSSRLALVALPLLLLSFLIAERALSVLIFRQPIFHRRVLIIGAGWAGRTIAQTLGQYGDGAYEVVGFVDDDPDKAGDGILLPEQPHTAGPVPILGDRHALSDLITQHHVSTLVLAITRGVQGKLLQTLMDCLEQGVDIIPMPVLYEQLTGRVPVAHVGDSWELSLPIDHAGTGALYPLTKRLLDLLLAGVGLLGLALLLPIVALAIYLDSPGPILYSQERVGLGGRPFRLWKLRSMVTDAERDGAQWAQKDDLRVTRVGRILRRTHLDELPQFWNIIKGEMSMVGPRPERPEFVAELAREIPFYRVRHAVKPGAAGWAQVRHGYGATKEDALLKLQYDLYYIKHQSLWLDLVIMLKTLADMITLGGR